MSKRVVVFGPGPQFKGGISNFTVSLCKAFEAAGQEVFLVSWKRQYPAIIPRDFIDHASKSNLLQGSNVKILTLTDYNNPLTWFKTAREIASIHPDLVVIQWAIAIQGLPIGVICWQLKKLLPSARIIFDVHNVVQKETGALDKILTRFALRKADAYIFHGQLTLEEFKQFMPTISLVSVKQKARSDEKKYIELFHPNYDIFNHPGTFDRDAERLRLGLNHHVFLFFGFIRKYKGLHWAIEAFAKVTEKHPDVSLLIVGESFWNKEDKKSWITSVQKALFKLAKRIFIKKSSDDKEYQPLALIEQLGIQNKVLTINRFVPNEEVYKWFLLSDAVLNFYEYATPSGVESLAYNFSKPVLATSVGHFAYAIKDGINGYLAQPGNIESMAAAIERQINEPVSPEKVRVYAAEMTWENYVRQILLLNASI